MVDATHIKAHPTASSLNKGGYTPPDWWHQGGMTSQLHGICDRKGGPLRLHLREGQCRDFTDSASDSAEPPDAPEPEVLMVDATHIKAHPTASSLNKGGCPRLIGGTKGGMTSQLHGVCDSKGGRLRLHLREGQCSDFTGADGVRKDLPPAATVMGDQG